MRWQSAAASPAELSQATLDLGVAAANGDLPGVIASLSKGGDPDAEVPKGAWPIKEERPRPLHIAFRRCDARLAKILIDAGADIEARSEEGAPMCHWIGSEDCAMAWIQAGGDPWRIWTHFGAGNHKALAHEAARWGGPRIWKAIADLRGPGPDLALSGSKHGSSIEIASEIVRWENVAAVEALGLSGWIPKGDTVESAALDVASYRVCGNNGRAIRSLRLCAALVSIGAPAPRADSSLGAISHVGRQAWESACLEVECAWANREAQMLSKAAKRAKPGRAPAKLRL